ncbi:hypothetical protein CB467_22750 [Salmonella enterica subsp. enterica serovar Goverdhan]|nr:hypothetical protein [Salmonella enterica subsp. enterica serovar Goverdhan]
MVNLCELLINVVIPDKPKILTGLNQKVCDRLFPSSLGIHGLEITGGEAEPNPFICILSGTW